jgi:hypothetical protein
VIFLKNNALEKTLSKYTESAKFKKCSSQNPRASKRSEKICSASVYYTKTIGVRILILFSSEGEDGEVFHEPPNGGFSWSVDAASGTCVSSHFSSQLS